MTIEDYMRQHAAGQGEHYDEIKKSLSTEERSLEYNAYHGRSIAVFTSGGDSQGMNSAVRAVVRIGRYLGCKVYFIKEGYQGMVDGGDHIVEAHWSSVSGIINKGGTMIGSARCMDFKEREGRLKAAKNLVERSITNLVVIGGDGSLTGANCFRNEWSGLLEELAIKKQITAAQAKKNAHLNIVGMVGSIDNDFCGTDMTIGTDSALHRIIEAVDCIIPTASSHQRTFIMEVMGRHCGYLALVAGIVSEADFVFIPEWPPSVNWPDKLCKKLIDGRDSGHRLNIIIVSEGAIDRQGKPITAEQVKKVVVDNLKQDTRITVLGHIQRGGAPSAFDRVLGCRMGVEAVLALMNATPDSEAMVVSLDGNASVCVPLMECVHKTQAVSRAMATKNWEVAVQLRGSGFKRNLDTYLMLTQNRPRHMATHVGKPSLRFGVMHVGAPCGGMNAAARSFVRNCILLGHHPVAIHNGVEGFAEGVIEQMTWESVNGWTPKGGALLGTKRTLPTGKLDRIAAQIVANNLQGIIIIGGFEAYSTGLTFADAREKIPEFRIPMVIIPATISNNVPGTDFSLGTDTAINTISEICDKLRQSAAGTKQRVFIVEIMGGYCGYLTSMAALASGSDIAYIHEDPFVMKDIMHDLTVLKEKIAENKIQTGLILRNEKASEEYTTKNLTRIYCEEGRGVFTVRSNVLGHMQQGGSPSPFDRNLGTEMAAKATHWIVQKAEANLYGDKVITQDKDSAVLLGIQKRHHNFWPVQNLREETDFPHRRAKEQWWFQMRSMMKMLVHHHNIEVKVDDIEHGLVPEPEPVPEDEAATEDELVKKHIPRPEEESSESE